MLLFLAAQSALQCCLLQAYANKEHIAHARRRQKTYDLPCIREFAAAENSPDLATTVSKVSFSKGRTHAGNEMQHSVEDYRDTVRKERLTSTELVR